MTKQEVEKSLTASAGGALVTIADISKWSGRSRDYLKKNVLDGLTWIGSDTARYYFAADVAHRICERARV